MQGKESHSTALGSLCSLMILVVMAMYASLKFDVLVNRHNPAVTTINKENEIGPSEVLNLHNAGLRVAFEVKSM